MERIISQDQAKPVHPGAYIKANVIPVGLTVKAAAETLGVGRPALSNLLNGNSALSPEMAVRLEKAFGADRRKLLDLQAAFERHLRRAGETEVAVRAFVPSFLTIKGRQIEDWADRQLEARSHLAVLLRKLVHSTGQDLLRVDFPGYDYAERKGSDGLVEAGGATPWIPKGKSYWEFGTDKKPSGKAEKDYAARLVSTDAADRANGTFIFVTPRKWSGKLEWEKKKTEAGEWKVVRALDVSDLEQWLEQSVPAQIWLAEKLGLPTTGYETLEAAWRRWTTASDPHMSAKIFAPSIVAYRGAFKDWLQKPSEKPFVLAGDSKDEALAFLSRLFDDGELRQWKDLAAVFTSPETLKSLVDSSVPFIPVVHSADVERELAEAHRRLHCIAFRPRNAVDTKADIALDLLSHEAFREALTDMGIKGDAVDRLGRESARSPTILRRRLSPIAAIKTPAWADDDATAKALGPMALIGAWHAESEADKEIARYLADRPYEAIEDDLARLLLFDDPPVWSAGQYRGVASKIDALFAVAKVVTKPDLDRFFDTAEYVLSESDPALDLPEYKRWAAGLYGKKRDHSAALRKGVCETLVILSVHGNNLFQFRLGVDLESRVAILVRNLLTPLTLEKLLSHNSDLPRYAEAAPDEFLRIVEKDLEQNLSDKDPVVFGLLKPVDKEALWASPSRTGLLWALECLAWKPQSLARVSAVLAQLCRPKIDDNWTNKPEASLHAIFRSWMPQTAASVEQRIKALETLAKRFPEIGWRIYIEQLRPGSRFGHDSYRPHWRSDASGAGHVVTNKEVYEFCRRALDLAIAWPSHDEKTLGDLVECLQGMPSEDQVSVWNLIEKWSENALDRAKAELRERIRRYAFTRRSRHRKLNDATKDQARAAYARLQPNDAVIRHRWLFAKQWIEPSGDEIGNEDFSFAKREEQIDRDRTTAMKEVWAARGFDGLKSLLESSDAAHVVGRYAPTCIISANDREDFLRRLLFLPEESRAKAEYCIQGFVHALDESTRAHLLNSVADGLHEDQLVRLFCTSPFQEATWRLLDNYGKDVRARYWKEVFPSWGRHTPAELIEIIDGLLEAKRPRAAFHAVHMDFEEIETSRLKRLLREVATVHTEPSDHFKLDAYYVSEALESLDGRPGVALDEMAQLEFLFIDALDDSEHGIPNLERQIAESPSLFVQAIALLYKRRDSGEDPPQWKIEDPEKRAMVAMAAHSLLDQTKKIPGTDDIGKIDSARLIAWLTEVRRLCRDYGRGDVGDQRLGQLLANAPADQDGLWPCRPVCTAMEEIASAEIGRGFSIGVHNARGAHWRGEGGGQERELAAKYRALAERLHFDYPYVGGVVERIASSYDREAGWHDSEASVEKRLRH